MQSVDGYACCLTAHEDRAFYAWYARDAQPFIALGKALKARGHNVVPGAPENFQSWIEGHGLAYRSISVDMQAFLRALEARKVPVPPLSLANQSELSNGRSSVFGPSVSAALPSITTVALRCNEVGISVKGGVGRSVRGWGHRRDSRRRSRIGGRPRSRNSRSLRLCMHPWAGRYEFSPLGAGTIRCATAPVASDRSRGSTSPWDPARDRRRSASTERPGGKVLRLRRLCVRLGCPRPGV
jgi:hypothetical protein